MDTLALLCNLHAEGPATLQRLRRTGCESLASLLSLESNDLAARLDWTERMAERFLREAALLAERLDEDVELSREVESEEDEERELIVDDESEHVLESDHEAVELTTLESAAEVAEVEMVLGAWRELDRVAPPEPPSDYVLPRPAAEARVLELPNRALDQVRIDGLTPELVRRLAEVGVLSLRGLAEAPDLELARKIPLSFTRLRHLQFLATKELAALPPVKREPATLSADEREAPEISAAFEFPQPRPERFETAGPFA